MKRDPVGCFGRSKLAPLLDKALAEVAKPNHKSFG
jgi:hypothetical protein